MVLRQYLELKALENAVRRHKHMQEGFSKRTSIPIVVIECGLGLQKLEVARDFGRCVQMSSDLDSSKVVVPDCLRDRALSIARKELTYTGFHPC